MLTLVIALLFSPVTHAQPCDFNSMRWQGMPFDKRLTEHSECKPQIFYSWVHDDFDINPDDGMWPFRRGRAFFFRSPLGSMLYGKFSYRVKIKPDVKFKATDFNEFDRTCSAPEQEKQNTIYVFYNPPMDYSEYIICSPDVVESWSFGMPEHLEEIMREREIIRSSGAKNVDGLMNPNSRHAKHSLRSSGLRKKSILGYTIWDARNSGSERDYKNAVSIMQKWVQAKKGRVYQMSDGKAYQEGQAVLDHFSTRLAFPFQQP